MDKRHKKEIEEALAPAKIIYAAKAETVDDFQQDDFLVSCENEGELKDCVKAIGTYNKFNPSKIKRALTAVNFSGIFGYRFWKIKIGLENSPVMFLVSTNSPIFRKKCREFARIAGADECDFYIDVSAEDRKNFRLNAEFIAQKWAHSKVRCRIWWD
ncbi:MAG: hypothetical protein AAB514_03565 [Patescibacteria group bacterium]